MAALKSAVLANNPSLDFGDADSVTMEPSRLTVAQLKAVCQTLLVNKTGENRPQLRCCCCCCCCCTYVLSLGCSCTGKKDVLIKNIFESALRCQCAAAA